MIEFMVLAAPRSATTWVANWLTTDTTLCLHDPLWQHYHKDLDSVPSTKRLGLSCTGLWMYTDWVNAHPARKVILHRPLDEVNASLEELGLLPMPADTDDRLNLIEGMHVPYMQVFSNPKPIYEYLLGLPFDQERHAQLLDIEMQPKFSGLKMDKAAVGRLVREMIAASQEDCPALPGTHL